MARGGERLTLDQPYVDTIPGPDGKPRAWAGSGRRSGTGYLRAAQPGPGDGRGRERPRLRASTQIVRTVRGLFSGRISGREVGGPILIGQLAGESARLGLDTFLGFMALISINLAILNLLPMPVLDGGQFLFLLAEAVIRRPLPMKLRERLTTVGWCSSFC